MSEIENIRRELERVKRRLNHHRWAIVVLLIGILFPPSLVISIPLYFLCYLVDIYIESKKKT